MMMISLCNLSYICQLPFSFTDIDECTQGKAECQHICNNTNGSYFCSCKDGYTLNSNGKNCLCKYYTYIDA